MVALYPAYSRDVEPRNVHFPIFQALGCKGLLEMAQHPADKCHPLAVTSIRETEETKSFMFIGKGMHTQDACQRNLASRVALLKRDCFK